MPKPKLEEPYNTLEREMIETGLYAFKQWRPDLEYPESVSDCEAFVRGILRRFDVKRRPLDVELPIARNV